MRSQLMVKRLSRSEEGLLYYIVDVETGIPVPRQPAFSDESDAEEHLAWMQRGISYRAEEIVEGVAPDPHGEGPLLWGRKCKVCGEVEACHEGTEGCYTWGSWLRAHIVQSFRRIRYGVQYGWLPDHSFLLGLLFAVLTVLAVLYLTGEVGR